MDPVHAAGSATPAGGPPPAAAATPQAPAAPQPPVLEAGTVVDVRVLRALADGRFLLALGDRTFVASSESELQPGSQVRLSVAQAAGDTIILRLAEPVRAEVSDPQQRLAALRLPATPANAAVLAAFEEAGAPLDPVRLQAAVRAAAAPGALPRTAQAHALLARASLPATPALVGVALRAADPRLPDVAGELAATTRPPATSRQGADAAPPRLPLPVDLPDTADGAPAIRRLFALAGVHPAPPAAQPPAMAAPSASAPPSQQPRPAIATPPGARASARIEPVPLQLSVQPTQAGVPAAAPRPAPVSIADSPAVPAPAAPAPAAPAAPATPATPAAPPAVVPAAAPASAPAASSTPPTSTPSLPLRTGTVPAEVVPPEPATAPAPRAAAPAPALPQPPSAATPTPAVPATPDRLPGPVAAASPSPGTPPRPATPVVAVDAAAIPDAAPIQVSDARPGLLRQVLRLVVSDPATPGPDQRPSVDGAPEPAAEGLVRPGPAASGGAPIRHVVADPNPAPAADAEPFRPAPPPATPLEEAVTRTVREHLAEQVFKPKDLSDYDRVVPLPLTTSQVTTPARLAVATRSTGGGAQATFVRVDAEMTRLGRVSIRLSGSDGGGPLAITLIAEPRAGTALAAELPALIADLHQAGIDAAVRVVADG